MTNTLAIWIVVVLACAVALDLYVLDWGASLFVARRFADLLAQLAFWR